MTTLRQTLEYLYQRSIPYIHSTHPVAYTAREVAAVEQISLRAIAKTVIFVTEQGFGMAVVPARSFVDLEALRALMGVEMVRLATEAELAELFPASEVGAMPPLGNLFGLAVYFDRSLESNTYLAFNAGTHRDLIQMSVKDFLRLTRPLCGYFAVHVESRARAKAAV